MSCSLWPHGPCFPVLHCHRVGSNSCPLSLWCHTTISSFFTPFSSWPQSFPKSGSFPMNQLFASGGPSFGASASASVLPVNIQCWCPFRIAVQGTLKCLLQHQSLNQESSPGYHILFSYFQHLLQHLTNSWCLINAFRMNAEYSKSTVPNLFSTRDWFHGRQFFHGQGCEGDGFGMNQAHYIYCALCFYYYYIRATPQHQALDLGGWGLLTCDRQVSRSNQELEVT